MSYLKRFPLVLFIVALLGFIPAATSSYQLPLGIFSPVATAIAPQTSFGQGLDLGEIDGGELPGPSVTINAQTGKPINSNGPSLAGVAAITDTYQLQSRIHFWHHSTSPEGFGRVRVHGNCTGNCPKESNGTFSVGTDFSAQLESADWKMTKTDQQISPDYFFGDYSVGKNIIFTWKLADGTQLPGQTYRIGRHGQIRLMLELRATDPANCAPPEARIFNIIDPKARKIINFVDEGLIDLPKAKGYSDWFKIPNTPKIHFQVIAYQTEPYDSSNEGGAITEERNNPNPASCFATPTTVASPTPTNSPTPTTTSQDGTYAFRPGCADVTYFAQYGAFNVAATVKSQDGSIDFSQTFAANSTDSNPDAHQDKWTNDLTNRGLIDLAVSGNFTPVGGVAQPINTSTTLDCRSGITPTVVLTPTEPAATVTPQGDEPTSTPITGCPAGKVRDDKGECRTPPSFWITGGAYAGCPNPDVITVKITGWGVKHQPDTTNQPDQLFVSQIGIWPAGWNPADVMDRMPTFEKLYGWRSYDPAVKNSFEFKWSDVRNWLGDANVYEASQIIVKVEDTDYDFKANYFVFKTPIKQSLNCGAQETATLTPVGDEPTITPTTGTVPTATPVYKACVPKPGENELCETAGVAVEGENLDLDNWSEPNQGGYNLWLIGGALLLIIAFVTRRRWMPVLGHIVG